MRPRQSQSGDTNTRINSYVDSDAAQYIQKGGIPFDWATYRYTPFLAQGLAPPRGGPVSLLPHRCPFWLDYSDIATTSRATTTQ
jgi:hypothetical protein